MEWREWLGLLRAMPISPVSGKLPLAGPRNGYTGRCANPRRQSAPGWARSRGANMTRSGIAWVAWVLSTSSADAPGQGGPAWGGGPLIGRRKAVVRGLGLQAPTALQAAVLAALLRLGEGTGADVARVAGVDRVRARNVLHKLRAHRVVAVVGYVTRRDGGVAQRCAMWRAARVADAGELLRWAACRGWGTTGVPFPSGSADQPTEACQTTPLLR